MEIPRPSLGPDAIHSTPEKAIDRTYPVIVVDPYALNIIDQGPRTGEVRLSFYSAFVARAARDLIENNYLDDDGQIVLFGDSSFGPDYPSTGALIKDYLTRERPEGPIISPDRIVLFDGPDMNQTSTQVKKLAEHLKARGLEGQRVAYLGWEYHMDRVKNHAAGYGVDTAYLMVEFVRSKYGSNFSLQNLRRLMDVLPMDEIEKMEKPRRKISRYDKKGLIPRALKPIIGGSYMLDNRRNPDGALSFEYKPGKKKLEELGIK